MKKERSKELFSPESCSPVLSGGIRDFTVHGTEPVPLHIYHQDYAHGGLSVPFHWHKELEWIWVEKGTLTLTLKTETRTISEGTFLFINSHELHQIFLFYECRGVPDEEKAGIAPEVQESDTCHF